MLFEGGFANFSPSSPLQVDFTNDDRAPLLFVAGGNDHILPPKVQRENYQKHSENSKAITAFKLFEGRDHLTCAEDGWEAVADFALNWAQNPLGGELGHVTDPAPDRQAA